jgi:hypothetical protein
MGGWNEFIERSHDDRREETRFASYHRFLSLAIHDMIGIISK